MTALSHMPQQPQLSQLALAADGYLHGMDRAFEGVGIDTRRLSSGAVFFALRGAHDGHEHVARAAELGAAGAVVERRMDADLAQIEVGDTLTALQQAGTTWRQAFAGPVVGITGSNGKTTVRRMLTSILAQRFAPVLASQGNFNNHLGVPLTLLGLRTEHASAVIEMGANHAGEIEQLSRLTRPGVGVITNAGDAHLEGFGSRDGVARAKGELYEQLDAQATAVINADDTYAQQWAATASHCRRLYFSLDGTAADVSADDVAIEGSGSRFSLHMPSGRAQVNLPLPGEHNVRNALAAAAVAAALDMQAAAVAAGLAQVTPVTGRLATSKALHGARVVDDSYNANPLSLNAALAWLGHQPGPRWLVLGDMAELGSVADEAHCNAGERARAEGIDRLWATGPKSEQAVKHFGQGGAWFADHAQLGAALKAAVAVAEAESHPPIVLVKGSRSARMDRVVTMLTEGQSGGPAC